MMQVHLQITGVLLIVLALMHIAFPKYFAWKEDLAQTSLLTRQIMYVHTFFIGLVVLMMGVLCLLYWDLLLQDKLGRIISFGISFFWFARFLCQLFVYSPKLWRGKKFETVVHILFTLLWVYFTVLFFLAAKV